MKFELGQSDGSDCHELLQPGIELWRDGNPHDAYVLARSLVKQSADPANPLRAIDWIFLSDLAVACGFYEISKVFTRAGFRHCPEDRMLGLLHAWDLSAAGKFFECKAALKLLQKTHSKDIVVTLKAIEAYNFSVIGWRTSAERSHEKVVPHAGDDPLVWYILARAASHRAEWDRAVEEGDRVMQLAPKWTRAISAHTDSLLAMGKVERATELLKDADNLPPSCSLDFSRAICAEARDDPDTSRFYLRQITERWSDKSKLVRFASRHLALMLLKENEFDEAETLITKHRLRKFESLKKTDGSQKFISVPLVSQAFNHCVPTVAAMVAGAQGVPLSPLDLAHAMMTRQGTPLFRMVDHMRSLGFNAECLRVDAKIVRELLDRNVPLIGSLTGLFNSHVDVICGYHSGLELFHLRDPMHWFGYSIQFDELEKHYAESGGLWALIAPEENQSNDSRFEIPDEWIDKAGRAYIDLGRACSRGEREFAEQAYEQIPDDSELAFARDSRSRAIVVTPGKFQETVDAMPIPTKGETPKLAQVRAMLMQINDQTADDIAELAQSKELKLAPQFSSYVRAMCLMSKHEWKDAEKILAELTHESPGFEQAWSYLSTVQSQLGKWSEAKKSLACAIDIAPDNEGLRNRAVILEGDNLTFQQRYDQVKQLKEEAVDSPEYLYDLSSVLMEGGDGQLYESTLKECTNYFPRDPGVWSDLTHWYLMQGRVDLAKQTMESGRDLIGEEELPVAEFEKSEEEQAANADSTAKAGKESKDEAAEITSESNEKHGPKPGSDSSKFQKLLDQVAEKMDQEERISFDELMAMPEVVELRKMDRSGKLQWQESSFLTSCLLRSAITDEKLASGSPKEHAKELSKLLPDKSMPGIPEHYALALLESLREDMPRLVAGELIKWIDARCKNIEQFASLQFERAFLLEQMALFNESEQQLQKIIKRHPAYSPAFYRLGQIATARDDYRGAIEFHKRCLEITPGNAGALDELILLCQHLQTDDAIDRLKQRTKLYPYSKQRLYETARAIGESSGHNAAVKHIDGATDCFSEMLRKLLIARYWTDVEEYDRASSIVNNVEPDEENRVVADWIKVDCMVGKQRFAEACPILEEMHERRSEDMEVVDQYARILREVDPDKAKQFAKSNLKKGKALSVLCFICFQDDFDPPHRVAKRIIRDTESEHQDSVVLAFNDALNQPEILREYIEYLRWANKSYPHLKDLRSSLAMRLNMAGNTDESIAIARGLLDEDPQNPQWLQLMGICIQDKDPMKSIDYLQHEYKVTGSSETLCRIARGFQLIGNDHLAKENYRKALDVNPHNTLAITNLAMQYKVQTNEIFDSMCTAIQLGYGTDDQYFHAMAVKTAIKLRRQVPHEWLPGALQRFEMAEAEGGYRDELPVLKKAIQAWAVKHDIDSIKNAIGNTFTRLAAKWMWPKSSWIPE